LITYRHSETKSPIENQLVIHCLQSYITICITDSGAEQVLNGI